MIKAIFFEVDEIFIPHDKETNIMYENIKLDI